MRVRDVQLQFYTFYFLPFLKRLEEESKKSNVRDVSCVAILSGRMTGVGGQSIAYVREKQYLCIVFRNDLDTRKRDVRSANDVRTLRIRNNHKIVTYMRAELIIPIESLRGALRKDGYYFRISDGLQIVQRCPRKWKDTPARKAAREKFIATYGKKKNT